MREIILDTNLLAEFLYQYFDNNIANRGFGKFIANTKMSLELTKNVNRIIQIYDETNDPSFSGLIISSAFAFIEIARQFEKIADSRFSLENLYDFIQNYPGWFSIAPVDKELLPSLIQIPTHIILNDENKSIELCDSIHVATVFSRGENSFMATTDLRIKEIPALKNRIL